jgi:phospholipase C
MRGSVGAAFLTLLTLLVVSGCGGGSVVSSVAPKASPTPQPTDAPLTVPSPGQVQHVVFIVQENRSFDNLFAGFPGADSASSGFTSNGKRLALAPWPLEKSGGYGHALADFLAADDNGKMDGFNLEQGVVDGYEPYSFVPRSEIEPYWQMAHQYVLADRMFASNIDASFAAHQYLIAGEAAGAVDYPSTNWGCTAGSAGRINTITSARTYGPQVVPCFDYPTIADELTQNHLSWRYYAPEINNAGGIWSAFQAVNHICGPISQVNGACTGPNWTPNVISPETQVLSDVPAGTLANVTWVVPDFLNSDHPGNLSASGPAWVASIVNAIGRSPFWKTSVIFVLWDDWGGWYDHVPPTMLDADGLGIRVPLLCISPYAARGAVSHVPYEFGSLLRFAEDALRLGRLSTSDRRATSAAVGCMNFAQPPRGFTPIGAARNARDLRRVRPSLTPPDDN